MDLKLGWKERAMPHLQQHHPVPQGHHSQPSVDWSPEAHKQSHYNCTASTGPKYTQTLPTQELTSFHVWVWQHHLTTVTPIPHVRNLSSCPTFHTIPAVCSQCSIGPTFDLYHSYEGTWQGSKIIHDKGHAHLTPITPSGCCLTVKARALYATPKWKQQNPHSHTATAHAWGHAHKLNYYFFKGHAVSVLKECFDVALMWAITGLFCGAHFQWLA